MKKQLLLLFTACVAAIASYAQAPTITSFTPASGPVGTLVTITGTNLSSPTAFVIGGASAIVVSDNGDTLMGMVMPGAATGAVSVTTAGGTAVGSSNYSVTPTLYPSVQEGSKLVGTGAVNGTNGANQGNAVAISADGSTAIMGGSYDSSQTGAAWVFTFSGGIWIQQGPKLVGTGAAGAAQQGISVALSADGNTALVGGWYDNSREGAAWVYIRSGGTWIQQGLKLVGTGAIIAHQGTAVSLSADGNTALVGGYSADTGAGAVWVYTRSGGTSSQQGSKLVGTGAVSMPPYGAEQGSSVSLSADGNTAIEGAPFDSSQKGAVWIYTRSGGIWTQQGSKLVGTGSAGPDHQGASVSLSADGNTAIVGGQIDTGAAWVYTRTGGIWTQEGPKLVGTGSVGNAGQGTAVYLSADGNTALVGAIGDNSGAGAVWVYTRSGGTWTQQGSKLVGTGATSDAKQGSAVSLSADGNTALVGGIGDNSGAGAVWIFSSAPTGIERISAPQDLITLHPNPNTGSFTLETSGAIGAGYTIYDMIGRQMAAATIISDSQPISVPLSPGIYQVTVRSLSGEVGTLRYEVLR